MAAATGLSIAALVVAAAPVGRASAATTEDSVTLNVDLDAPGSGTLIAFDPALGSLTSVELTIRTDVAVQTCIENLSTESGTTVGGPVAGLLEAQFPTAQNATTAVVDTTIPATTLPVSNGSDDCAGGLDAATGRYPSPVAASDVHYFEDDDTATTARTFTAPADMAPFVGPGTVPYSFDSSSLADITQPSEWDIVFVAKGSLAITVRYTYSPTGTTTTSVPCVPPTTTVAGQVPPTTRPGTVFCAPLPVTGGSNAGLAIAAAVITLMGAAALGVSSRRRRTV